MKLTIIFQNESFVVVDKPSGMLSVPSRMGAKDPRPVLGKILEIQLGTPVYPVHRLDEEVSGLILFAIAHNAHRASNQWFEKHTIQKTYIALSLPASHDVGSKYISENLWESKLMRGKKRAYEADFGKLAQTKASIIGHNHKNQSIWKLLPLTGRSHQLRYEMMKHDFPIIGDKLYGSHESYAPSNGIALRAHKLDFTLCHNHPQFGLPKEIEIPAGIDFIPVL